MTDTAWRAEAMKFYDVTADGGGHVLGTAYITTASGTQLYAVTVSSGYVEVWVEGSNYDKLFVVNIEDLNNPSVVGTLVKPRNTGNNYYWYTAGDIFTMGNTVYVLASSNGATGGKFGQGADTRADAIHVSTHSSAG